MRGWVLGLLLMAGLCCQLACWGKFTDTPENAAPDPAPAAQAGAGAQNAAPNAGLDQRHQQRIAAQEEALDERHEDHGVEELEFTLDDDEPTSSEAGATTASEVFIQRFLAQKYKTQAGFKNPLMKYFPREKEWKAFGTIKNKQLTQAYTVECFVFYTDTDEWECRRIKFDGVTVFNINNPDPEIVLANIKALEDGRLDVKASAMSDQNAESTTKTAEQEAENKLRLARTLIKRKPEIAKKRLQEILDQFPNTPAAEEAAKLLKRAKN